MPARSRRNEEAIFHAALEIADPGDRAAYLEENCGSDVRLRRRLDKLLRAHQTVARKFEDGVIGFDPGSLCPPGNELAEGPGSVIGRYKLLEQIGEGGFGVVYLAEQQEPVTRKVALKVIKLGMDTRQVVARFEAERQALALMDHPSIASVLDGGATESGRPYFVMELVTGVPITKFCEENGLTIRERLELLIKVCHAVQHAHQKGIIHRDLKPSNVMVTFHDGEPVPKVIDFGVSKAINQRLTERTLFTNYAQMVGTPAYMSPEQAEMSGLDVDTRSDVYSLGVLLYELLTGATPHDAKRLASVAYGEMQRIIQEEDPPRPSTRLIARSSKMSQSRAPTIHGLKSDLDWIVMKALEKDRRRRYETADALALDLARYLKDEPVSAVAPSAGYRFGKLVRRNRGPVVAVLAVATALLAGTIVSAWQAMRASGQSRAALEAKGETEEALGVAETARAELARTIAVADFDRAADLLANGDAAASLSLLARAMRTDQDYHPAAMRAVSIMTEHNFSLNPVESFVQTGPIGQWGFDPSGRYAWTTDHSRKEEYVGRSSLASGRGMLWDLEKRTGVSLTEEGEKVRNLQFADSGATLFGIVEGAEGILRVWSVPDGDIVAQRLCTDASRFVVGGDGAIGVYLAVVAAENRSVQLWRWNKGNVMPVGKPLAFQDRQVGAALFSPDGRRLAILYPGDGAGGSVRVHAVESGKEVANFEVPDLSGTKSISFSPGGRFLLHHQNDQDRKEASAIWWPLDGGGPNPRADAPALLAIHTESIPRFLPGRERVVLRNPESDRLDIHHLQSRQRLFSIAPGGKVTRGPFFRARPGSSHTLAFAVVGCVLDESRLAVWSLETGKRLLETSHVGKIREAFFTPEGRRVAMLTGVDRHADWRERGGDTFGAGQRVQIWEVFSRQPAAPAMNLEVIRDVGNLFFGPEGERFFSRDLGLRSRVRVWNSRTGRIVREPFTLAERGMFRFPHFIDGGSKVVNWHRSNSFIMGYRTLLTGELTTWNAEVASLGSPPLRAVGGTVRHVELSADGRRALAVGSDSDPRPGFCQIWEVDSRRLVRIIRDESKLLTAGFDPGGERVVTADEDRKVKVWNLSSFSTDPEAIGEHPVLQPSSESEDQASERVLEAQFPTGDRIVTMTGRVTEKGEIGNSMLHLWKVGGSTVKRFKSEPHLSLTAVNSPTPRSPDGSLLLVSPADHGFTVGVLDVKNGEVLGTWTDPQQKLISTAQFSPDGKFIIVTQSASKAYLLDPETLEQIREWNHGNEFNRVGVVNPAGTKVAITTGYDEKQPHGKVFIHGVRPGTNSSIEIDAAAGTRWIQFSPDGAFLATESYLSTVGDLVRVWDVATGKLVAGPLVMPGDALALKFLPGGRQLLAASTAGEIRLLDLPPCPTDLSPTPAWLPDLAEAVARKRVGGSGGFSGVSHEDLQRIRARLDALDSADAWTRWAKWFLADSATRALSPGSSVSASEHFEQLVANEDLDDLRTVLLLKPEHAATFGKIASILSRSNRLADLTPGARAHWLATAAWYSGRAIELDPGSPALGQLHEQLTSQLQAARSYAQPTREQN